jgi:non-heme chloroperoxidase
MVAAMTHKLRTLLLGFGALLILIVGAFAAVIAFDSPRAPPTLAAGDSIPGMQAWNFAEIPKPQRIAARDGAPLVYRLYPGRSDRVVVLVHGSTGSGVEMHQVAKALQAEGATVYAIALRGHGGSGTRNGDVSYVGQLDDDLADLTKAVGVDKPGIRRTLMGFSAGGGFVLRIASGSQAAMFDNYIAVSPYLGQDSPTNRPNVGGWTSIAVPRIVALSILAQAGLPWFQDLPVVHFATQAKADDNRTPVYSFRLLASLNIGRNWREALAHTQPPTRIVVGADDELFLADRFAPLLKEINQRIGVTILPGHGHLGMIGDLSAAISLATIWKESAGS